MAAKEEKSKAAPAARKTTAKAAPAAKTAVKPTTKRATTSKAKTPEITDAMIAEHAYYLSQSGEGSDVDHWLRAEAELKG